MFELEVFDHLTVCKQIADPLLNCLVPSIGMYHI